MPGRKLHGDAESDHAFASIQNSRATQFVVELNAGCSRSSARWSFDNIDWWRDSGRSSNGNPSALITSRAAITGCGSWSNWQVSTQRVLIENSSRNRVVCGSCPDAFGAKISRRNSCHCSVVGRINFGAARSHQRATDAIDRCCDHGCGDDANTDRAGNSAADTSRRYCLCQKLS